MIAPHPKIAWQMNKTPATISFVTEAAVAIHTRDDLDQHEKTLLAQQIKLLISGCASLGDSLTVDDWLERLRDHHP